MFIVLYQVFKCFEGGNTSLAKDKNELYFSLSNTSNNDNIAKQRERTVLFFVSFSKSGRSNFCLKASSD